MHTESQPTHPPPRPPLPTYRSEREIDNLAREYAFEPLQVVGTIPNELRNGTMVRNGPGLFERGGVRLAHLFDGDGAVLATRMVNGEATGTARFVETAARAKEQATGRWLFGGYKQSFQKPLMEMLFGRNKNPANTGVLHWQRRLFALCEAGAPIELDPDKLSTLGDTDLEGVVLHSVNPHPKTIASRRATYSIGMQHGRTHKVDVYEFPFVGKARRIATLDAHTVGMVHDFAVTGRHVVLFLPPMHFHLSRIFFQKKGIVDAIQWDASKGTEVVIIPLDDPNRVTRFVTDAFYMEHVANAYEDGEEIVVEYTRYRDLETFENMVEPLIRGRANGAVNMSVSRMRINPHARRAANEILFEEGCELPHTSSLRRGKLHRFTYLAAQPTKDDTHALFSATLKIDQKLQRIERFSFGEGTASGEPIFIPRVNAASEDDGYLLVLVYDPRRHISYEAILDAHRLSEGPVATIVHPEAIPPRFHGTWVPR